MGRRAGLTNTEAETEAMQPQAEDRLHGKSGSPLEALREAWPCQHCFLQLGKEISGVVVHLACGTSAKTATRG